MFSGLVGKTNLVCNSKLSCHSVWFFSALIFVWFWILSLWFSYVKDTWTRSIALQSAHFKRSFDIQIFRPPKCHNIFQHKLSRFDQLALSIPNFNGYSVMMMEYDTKTENFHNHVQRISKKNKMESCPHQSNSRS